jgi:hypothetical protein
LEGLPASLEAAMEPCAHGVFMCRSCVVFGVEPGGWRRGVRVGPRVGQHTVGAGRPEPRVLPPG